MNNQRNISQSYFVYKKEIKTKIKRRFKKIIDCEEYKQLILDTEDIYDVHTKQCIRLLNNMIKNWKEKSDKETEVYTYG